MIYITKEDVLTWLDKHEPVANRQKDIAAVKTLTKSSL